MNRRQLFVLLLLGAAAAPLAIEAQNPQPGPRAQRRQRPQRPRAQGPLVRIPSAVAGDEGLVLRLVLPKQPRYKEGAPVVIQVPGGFSMGGVDSTQGRHNEFGFVEVLMTFPGGRSAPQADGKVWRSGGDYDSRGENCVRGLADVIAFAQGQLRTVDGKTIQEVAGSVPLLKKNVGVIGWSFGGNIVPAALAHDAKAAAGMAWYASHESPYGDGIINGEFGARNAGPNPFYDPDTEKFDLTTLRYAPELVPAQLPRPQEPVADVTGCLYHDGNGNGRYDEDADFLLSGVMFPGPLPNYYYSRLVTAEAARRKLFGSTWPSHIANLAQVEKFLDVRDGVTPAPKAVKNAPELAVLIWSCERDHVQRTPDHRHIRLQNDAFLDAGARWVRVNPDAHYLEWVMGKKPSRVVQNPAGKRYDSRAIRPATTPTVQDGGASTTEGLAAAACELADRTQKGEWSATLEAVLYPDAPRSDLRPPRPASPGR